MKTRAILCAAAVYGAAAVAQAQTITVSAPNGGESWAQKSVHAIQWSSAGLPAGQTVNIILWLNGARLGDIALNVPAAQGQYQWTVGTYQGGQATAGAGYAVRVRVPNGILDDSNGPFTVTAAAGGVFGQAAGSQPLVPVDPSPVGVLGSVQKQPMTQLPDLVVCASSTNLSFWPAGGLPGAVVNRGEVPTGPTTVRFAVQGFPTKDLQVPGLNPAQSHSLVYKLVVEAGFTPPLPGNHYTLTVDPLHKVREYNEGNNGLTRGLAITAWNSGAAPPPPPGMICSDGTTLP